MNLNYKRSSTNKNFNHLFLQTRPTMAAASKSSKTSKSDASKTKAGDQKPTYEELQGLLVEALEEIETLKLTNNTVILKPDQPWESDAFTTIYPQEIENEDVTTTNNHVTENFTATMLKVKFLIHSMNDFFVDDLYEARISEDREKIKLTMPTVPNYVREDPQGFFQDKKPLTSQEILTFMLKHNVTEDEAPKFRNIGC